MIKKTVLDMRKLYELREKGYDWRTIAHVLSTSPETIRTILGGIVKGEERRSAPTLRKCA